MNVQESQNSAFPDFTTFGMEPKHCGAVVEISAKGDDGNVVNAALWMTPHGHVAGLDIREGGGELDEHEQYLLEILTERCCQGNWALAGLKNITPSGTYAWALVLDAIAAVQGCEG